MILKTTTQINKKRLAWQITNTRIKNWKRETKIFVNVPKHQHDLDKLIFKISFCFRVETSKEEQFWLWVTKERKMKSPSRSTIIH